MGTGVSLVPPASALHPCSEGQALGEDQELRDDSGSLQASGGIMTEVTVAGRPGARVGGPAGPGRRGVLGGGT